MKILRANEASIHYEIEMDYGYGMEMIPWEDNPNPDPKNTDQWIPAHGIHSFFITHPKNDNTNIQRHCNTPR
jgi:hypothetical protein